MQIEADSFKMGKTIRFRARNKSNLLARLKKTVHSCLIIQQIEFLMFLHFYKSGVTNLIKTKKI